MELVDHSFGRTRTAALLSPSFSSGATRLLVPRQVSILRKTLDTCQ